MPIQGLAWQYACRYPQPRGGAGSRVRATRCRAAYESNSLRKGYAVAACAQCGANVPEGSGFCPVCGAAVAGAASPPPGPQQAPQYGAQPQYGAPPQPQYGAQPQPQYGSAPAAGTSVNLDLSRLTWADALFTGGALLVFISYFLSWYSVSVPFFGGGSASLSQAGGWRVLILLVTIVALVYGVLKALGLAAKIPVATWQAMVGIGGLNLLLLLVAFIDMPSAPGVSVSWSFGAFFGLIFGIAAAVGAYLEKAGAPAIMKGNRS